MGPVPGRTMWLVLSSSLPSSSSLLLLLLLLWLMLLGCLVVVVHRFLVYTTVFPNIAAETRFARERSSVATCSCNSRSQSMVRLVGSISGAFDVHMYLTCTPAIFRVSSALFTRTSTKQPWTVAGKGG